MEEKLGVVELAQLVKGVGDIGSLTWEVLEDGTVNFQDLDELWAILKSGQGLVGIDYTKALAEWKDLDDEEKTFLIEEFKKSFDGPLDDIEALVEAMVGLALELYSLIKNIIKTFKK